MRRLGVALSLGSAVVLAGLGLTALSRAQQPRPEAGDRRLDPTESRSRLAGLRAEVELRQLEHEAARAQLLDMLKRAERVEFLREARALTPVGLAGEYLKALTGVADVDDSMARAHLMALAEGGKDAERKFYDDAEKDIKQLGEKLRAGLDRLRGEFVERAISLNEKRLDLAEAERRYDGAR